MGVGVIWERHKEVEYELTLLRKAKLPFLAGVGAHISSMTSIAGLENSICAMTLVCDSYFVF